jgi:lysozyme
MGRKRAFSWRTRIAALVLLAALGGGGYLWWFSQHWAPPRDEFPEQGVVVGAQDGEVDF